MKSRPPIGLTGEQHFVVGTIHVVEFAGDGMPAVLSTPQLIGWLEKTARLALAPLLEDHERTVGTEIDLRHLAPTPLGARVTCVARVVAVAGPVVTFQVEARDGVETLARGLHRRAVIRVDAFSRRLARKASAVAG